MPANTRNSPDPQVLATLRAEFGRMRDELSSKIDSLKANFDAVIAQKDEKLYRFGKENK